MVVWQQGLGRKPDFNARCRARVCALRRYEQGRRPAWFMIIQNRHVHAATILEGITYSKWRPAGATHES